MADRTVRQTDALGGGAGQSLKWEMSTFMTTKHQRSPILLILVILVAAGTGCATDIAIDQRTNLLTSKLIVVNVQATRMAEEAIDRFDSSSDRYLRVKRAYERAHDAANAFISLVQEEIAAGAISPPAELLEELYAWVILAVHELEKALLDIHVADSMPMPIEAIAVAGLAFDLIMELHEQYEESLSRQREQAIDQLEKRKWKSWIELENSLRGEATVHSISWDAMTCDLTAGHVVKACGITHRVPYGVVNIATRIHEAVSIALTRT